MCSRCDARKLWVIRLLERCEDGRRLDARQGAPRGEPRVGGRPRLRGSRDRRQPPRAPDDPGAAGGREDPGGPALGRGGDHPARRPLRRAGPPRAPGLPEPWRRSDRVRGAAGRLHGGGLPRAAHAARPAPRAPRDRDAPRRGRAPPRRPGTQRGRADPRADRRGALPQRARVRHPRRLARLRRRQAGARGGGGRARGAREPGGSGARGRGRPGDRARDPAADDARRRRRTSPRTRSATPVRERRSRSRSSTRTVLSSSAGPTTASASTRPS